MSKTSTLMEIVLEKKMTVKDLLLQLNLQEQFFSMLVDGKVVSLNDTIEMGNKVIILPKIAGG